MAFHRNHPGRFVWPLVVPVLAGTIVASAAPALAHEGEEITDQTAWTAWLFTPDIVIPTVLLVAVYGAGMIRRRASAVPTPWWRHLMFFAGVAAVFLALQSPIDPVAERLFFVHQVQHLLLRMIGPMLLALSWPQGLLTAGLPAPVRRTLLASVVSNTAVRWTFGVLAHPVVATVLYIAALYIWEIPRYHNLALLNEPVHYVMHITMLLAGLFFWWRIFDRRPPHSAKEDQEAVGHQRPLPAGRTAPRGLRYGVRMMLLWLALLSNILLGAYTTLKDTVLYDAYDQIGRLYGFAALADEKFGGIVIWIPGSMMYLIAMLVVVHLWGLHETHRDERQTAWPGATSPVEPSPVTADAVIERSRRKNRTMAIGFGMFAVTVFATAILVGVLYHMSEIFGPHLAAHGSVAHALQNGASSTLH